VISFSYSFFVQLEALPLLSAVAGGFSCETEGPQTLLVHPATRLAAGWPPLRKPASSHSNCHVTLGSAQQLSVLRDTDRTFDLKILQATRLVKHSIIAIESGDVAIEDEVEAEDPLAAVRGAAEDAAEAAAPPAAGARPPTVWEGRKHHSWKREASRVVADSGAEHRADAFLVRGIDVLEVAAGADSSQPSRQLGC